MESRGPFPGHVTHVLETFYRRGMDGWSGDKAILFQEALGSTPLKETQLKVGRFSLYSSHKSMKQQ